jgi:hypothetical protein
MNNDPVFDPIFNTAPLPQQDRLVPENARYRFDGWSYEPLTAERMDERAQVLEPQQ